MIYFILTKSGFEEVKGQLGHPPSPAWLNPGVLTKEEVDDLRRSGSDLTVFSSAIDPHDSEAITAELWIIQEHHPGKSIWVEFAPSPE